MNYAQVVDGTVVNIIVWDGTTEVDLSGELVAINGAPCDIGWLYDGTNFIDPNPEPDAPA